MPADLGRDGPTFRHAIEELRRLHHQVEQDPDVQARYQEWQSRLSVVYGQPVGDAELFAVHTYISILARLVASRALHPNTGPLHGEDLVKLINGDYFRERDIYNFAEDDFFAWTLNPKVQDDSMKLVATLSEALDSFDPASDGYQLLLALFQEIGQPRPRQNPGQPQTDRQLPEHILQQLQDNPQLSLLDPTCGPGTFLFDAIRLIREGMASRGEDGLSTLLHILGNVMGMDLDPAALAVARTGYLLALGDLISGPHPPVLVPLYLARPIDLLETAASESQPGHEEPVHVVETSLPKVTFQLPDSVVADPAQLDWLFHRMGQYLHAAHLRTGMEGESEATEGVIGALYSYLTSPKRAGLRKLPPLSPFAAGVMCDTARTLIKLTLEGRGNIWLHILSNSPASVFLSRRKFDLVVARENTII